MNPLVSVIIPTHNRAKLLPRAVNSVLEQTFKDFEIIIIDDASSDNTKEILEELKRQDPRIRSLRLGQNRGAQAARNVGIKASCAKWIAFLDSDDEWLSRKLEWQFLLANETKAEVISGLCLRWVEGEPTPTIWNLPKLSGNAYRSLLKSSSTMFQGLLVKRKLLEKIGYLDEAIVSFQEWDTAIRLAEIAQFAFVDSPLFIYHLHNEDTISKDMIRDASGFAQIVKKHKEQILKNAGKEALYNHYKSIYNRYNRISHSSRFLYRNKYKELDNIRLRFKRLLLFAKRNAKKLFNKIERIGN